MDRAEQDKMEAVAIGELMRLLANHRWAKATPAQKAEQARKMVAGRAKARAKRRKK